ncbi:hypothetical protein F5Y12DRAFT_798695 [Xylaria sp. FL1777]|nr:hypothetical protein F5Y12DRAFT_798695 [Xylaria sp. FL1777]
MSSHDVLFNPGLEEEDRGKQNLIIALMLSVLISLSTGARILSKVWLKKRLGFDDLFIFIGFAFNMAGNILGVAAVFNGYGRHLQFLDIEQRNITRKYILYVILLGSIALWGTKVSVSIFLLALITGAHQRAMWIIYGLIAITTGASACQVIAWLLQASPLQKAWTPDIPGTVRPPSFLLTAHVVSQAIGSVTDIFYALSPIYFFGKLQLSLRKKVVLLSLTGSGLLVVAISFAHLALVNTFYNPDYTWGLHEVFIFTLIERNVAEVIADLPPLSPIFRMVHKRVRDTIEHWSGGSDRNGDTCSTKPPLLSIITIGSAGKDKKKRGGAGDFSVYGRNAQFAELDFICIDNQVRFKDSALLHNA